MLRNFLKPAVIVALAFCAAPSFAVPVVDITADVLLAMAPDLRKALALNPNQQILWGQVDGRSHAILRERNARRERLQRQAKTVVTTPSPELRTLGAAMDAEDAAVQAEDKQLREMWLTVNDALDEKQRGQVAEFIGEQLERVEGGPTHQPVEQLTSLRTTPNLDTWRPADAVESAAAWKFALERNDGPSALIFSRQNLNHQTRDAGQIADINRGGYVLKDCAGEPELILISAGSEVGLTVQAWEKLTEQGRKVRVVSMPCTSVYEAQDAGYKQSVLPLQVSARIAIEASHADYWYKYVGLEGRVIGMTTYGESAPAPALFEEFGFTLENILGQAEELLED